MAKFLTRHPYYKNLLKLTGYIFVGYNALALCLLFPLILLVVIGLALGGGASTSNISNLQTVFGKGTNQLLSIKVSGVIVGDSDEASPLGFGNNDTSGYEVKQKLYAAADDDSIKGVVLEINSPGGTIYGAHAIADGVKYYKAATHRPVYAFVSGLGASGAYWAAVSADKVMADYGSDVGSIGVIMGPFEYYDKVVAQDSGLLGGGVVTQNGITQYNITAGKSKDLGNPYRRLTTDEIAALQKQVNNDYDLFVQYVSERRGIPTDTIKNTIGAMAYDNKSATDLKLIDGTASREVTYQALAKAAGLGDNYVVMREQTPKGLVASLLGAITGRPQTQATSSAPASAVTACAITKSAMAYYGDLANLCP